MQRMFEKRISSHSLRFPGIFQDILALFSIILSFFL